PASWKAWLHLNCAHSATVFVTTRAFSAKQLAMAGRAKVQMNGFPKVALGRQSIQTLRSLFLSADLLSTSDGPLTRPAVSGILPRQSLRPLLILPSSAGAATM